MSDAGEDRKAIKFPSTLTLAIQHMRCALERANIESAELDARLLVLGASHKTLNTLIAHPNLPLSIEVEQRAEEWLSRRLQGEPVARILGEKEFWGLPFGLSSETLVPRPDTETLIEVALNLFAYPPQRILDLGTGSGCILLALLSEWKTTTGIGIDIAPLALSQARDNAERLALTNRAEFILSDWDKALPDERFDLILSNPPYIPTHDIASLSREVRYYDPLKALDGGEDGLDDYRKIAQIAHSRLKPSGWLILELGIGQEADVSNLLQEQGFTNIASKPDLAGIPRALFGQK